MEITIDGDTLYFSSEEFKIVFVKATHEEEMRYIEIAKESKSR
jgi:YHS domain-containing protein